MKTSLCLTLSLSLALQGSPIFAASVRIAAAPAPRVVLSPLAPQQTPRLALPAARLLAPSAPAPVAPVRAPAPALAAGAQVAAVSARMEASAPRADAPVEASSAWAASLFGESQPPAMAAAVSGAEGSGRASLGPAAQGQAGAAPPPAPPSKPARRPFFIRHHRLARALLSPLVRAFYRVDASGLSNLPAGPALVVPNHVSYVDAIIISYAAARPMRFMLYRPIYERFPRLFSALGAIPVSSKDSKAEIEASLETARASLRAGETVVIFPEGALTRNGNMAGFRRGLERIADGVPSAPVVPAHIEGLWGSVFSRDGSRSFWGKLRQTPRRVTVAFGRPLETVSAQTAREAVQELGAESMGRRVERGGRTLPLAFLDAAKRNWKSRAAADTTGKSVSFGETLTGAVLLGGLLRTEAGAASRVGVLLPPTVGAALANLGLSVAGLVPVNYNYTAGADAVAHAAASAGLETVVTSKKFVEVLKEKGAALPPGRYVYLEDLLTRVPKWKKTLTYLALRLLPKALVSATFLRRAPRDMGSEATILFTSGSSALPKGVVLTHANIRSNIEMVREVFALTAADGVLGVLPFFHSFGFTVTLWLPLTLGLRAAYHTHPLETDSIAKLATAEKPTLLLGTPTFLQRYTQKIKAEAFASLRAVVAGAEKLRGTTADEFQSKFGVRPLEGYGATELSPVATVNVFDADGQTGTKEGTVGHPLPGVAAKVVDPITLKSLPLGQQGMLLIKGPNVMEGYLSQPEKTAEVLRDGWYVTGDLATMDRDGFIRLEGRLSRFSKIAGEMVSHVAVEEKLQQAAGLTEQVFVVAAVPDAQRGERLVVLYSAWDGDVDTLLTKAKALGMPNLWVPGRGSFYRIDEIPLLGTGKLDLRAVNELARKLAGSST